MRTILLTGGAGYIGAHTCVELLNGGYEVVVVDNYYNSCPEALNRVEEITGKKVARYEADVCDKEALRRVFSENAIDAVIHFAGLKAVGESVEKPLAYYRNNLDSTLTLLETMYEFGVKKIVFSSSATVYGTQATEQYVEGMTTGAANPYGWTKYMIEQILRDAAYADKTMGVVLLRYFNPVGAHESGRIGEDPSGIPNNLMPRILKSVIGNLGTTLGIFGDDYPTPDGTCIRDYIHVVDLAKGHVAAIRYLEHFTGSDEINLGSGEGVSVKQLFSAFERATGKKLEYTIQPRRAGDLPAYYANAEKAYRLLGWKTEKTIEDMCRDAWRWQSMNPNGYRENA
ncbi:MAG: UDP-glucose 4-epimerase GalE [Christensenellales bacterium]|jgi:UDP-glucose 4-epimerase